MDKAEIANYYSSLSNGEKGRFTAFLSIHLGEWDSEEDFARHIISECYNLESEMGDLARYFDYEAFLQSKRLR